MVSAVIIYARIPKKLAERLAAFRTARDRVGEDGSISASVRALLVAGLDHEDAIAPFRQQYRGRRVKK